jgi:carboxypeptidase Taq
MPKDAEPVRAEQVKLLAELTHAVKTGPEFEKELKALGDIKTGKVKGKGLTQTQETIVKLILKDYIREKKLPSSFVQKLAQQNSKNICGWQEARKTNAFAHFLPMLTKSIALFIKKADYIGYKR